MMYYQITSGFILSRLDRVNLVDILKNTLSLKEKAQK